MFRHICLQDVPKLLECMLDWGDQYCNGKLRASFVILSLRELESEQMSLHKVKNTIHNGTNWRITENSGTNQFLGGTVTRHHHAASSKQQQAS
jgi:hypothetical protein